MSVVDILNLRDNQFRVRLSLQKGKIEGIHFSEKQVHRPTIERYVMNYKKDDMFERP
jgi:hypothetical protein